MEQQKQQDEIIEERRSQIGSGERSEKIRTYNYPQNRVTDHRLDLSLHNLPAIIQGDLDPLLDPLVAQEQADRLSKVAA